MSNKLHTSQVELENTTCGCQLPCQKSTQRLRVKFLQRFVKPPLVLFLLTFGSFLYQTVISGLYGMSISTIEKRFQLQSSETGLIAAIHDVFSVLGMLLILVVGSNVNQPIWIGIGMFLMSLGCFIFSLPHFIAPVYSPIVFTNGSNVCFDITLPSCMSSDLRNYKYMFVVGLVIFGSGMAPLYSYGITYIDRMVSKNKSALYTSIFYGLAALGPAAGFVGGGALLETYTYIGEEPAGVTSDNYAWVGAWWMGYITVAVLLFINSLFVYMLPRNPPDSNKFQFERNSEVQATHLDDETDQKNSSETSLIDALKYLLTNKCLMLCIFGNLLNFAFIHGFNTFGAKYFEAQLGLEPFMSAVLYGVTSIFACVFSQLLSGFILFKFKLNVSQIIKMMLICSVVSAMFSFGLFIHCPDIIFAGGTIPYSDSNVTMLDSTCNANCGCSTDLYEPVCGADNVTYFSPCYAGCETKNLNGTFQDCSCVPSKIAHPGICEQSFCKNVYLFNTLIFFAFFTSLMTYSPSMQVTLRCVPFNLRVRSVTLNRILTFIFGTAPGRIITGVLVDLACASWQTDCSEQGSCAVYHRKEMARNIAIILLVETWAMVLVYILLSLTYVPQGSNTKLEEDSHNQKKNLELQEVYDHVDS